MWVISDFIKRSWDEIIYSESFGTMVQISRIYKEDSFSHGSVVPSHMAQKLYGKGWRDVLLMIRFLFTVSVSNAKLERMFSKLKPISTALFGMKLLENIF